MSSLVDETGAYRVDGALQAVWLGRATPAAANVPGWHIQRSGTFGVEGAGHCDHVVHLVVLSEAGAQEDTA